MGRCASPNPSLSVCPSWWLGHGPRLSLQGRLPQAHFTTLLRYCGLVWVFEHHVCGLEFLSSCDSVFGLVFCLTSHSCRPYLLLVLVVIAETRGLPASPLPSSSSSPLVLLPSLELTSVSSSTRCALVVVSSQHRHVGWPRSGSSVSLLSS